MTNSASSTKRFWIFTGSYIAIHLLFWIPSSLALNSSSPDDFLKYMRVATEFLVWHGVFIPGTAFCFFTGRAIWKIKTKSTARLNYWRYLAVIFGCALPTYRYAMIFAVAVT